MKLTYELIQSVANCGSLNRTQAELIGTPFPLETGWIDTLIGKEIKTSAYAQALTVKGLSPGKRKRVMRLEKQAELL